MLILIEVELLHLGQAGKSILDPGYKSMRKDHQPWEVQVFTKGAVCYTLHLRLSAEKQKEIRGSPVAAAPHGWEQLERLFQNHSQMQIHLIRGSGISLVGE